MITKLFPNDPISQRMAANFVELYENAPQVREDQIEALLREGAGVNQAFAKGEITAEVGLAQLGGFAETIGTPEHLVNDGLAFLQAGAWVEPEEIAAIETPGADPAQAPRVPQVQARPAPGAAPSAPLSEQHEKNMRAPEGSPEWRAYWKDGGSAAYLGALERLQASTDALATVASGTAAPAPAQTGPAATPALGPAAPVAPPASPAA